MEAAQGWQEPFYGEVSEQVIALYCVNFRLPRGDRQRGDVAVSASKADGVACINYSLEDIAEIIGGFDLGQTGYGLVVSAQGTYLVHPLEEYVRQQRTIFDAARARDDAVYFELAAG